MWKKKLKELEDKKQWDVAIAFMEKVIAENQDSVDAYLSLQYLIMNLLVEDREYDGSNRDSYVKKLQKYFHEAYEKFSENSEYLYYTGRTAVMSDWYFGFEGNEAHEMIDKAAELEPDNKVYQWNSFRDLNPLHDREKLEPYIYDVFDSHSDIRKELDSKGSLGTYLLNIMTYVLQKKQLQIRCIDEKKIDWSRALRASVCFFSQSITKDESKISNSLKNKLESPLYSSLSTMEKWEDLYKDTEIKNYRDSYTIMMRLVAKYLEDNDLYLSTLEGMKLVKGKQKTVDPQYWDIWHACVLETLGKS